MECAHLRVPINSDDASTRSRIIWANAVSVRMRLRSQVVEERLTNLAITVKMAFKFFRV